MKQELRIKIDIRLPVEDGDAFDMARRISMVDTAVSGALSSEAFDGASIAVNSKLVSPRKKEADGVIVTQEERDLLTRSDLLDRNEPEDLEEVGNLQELGPFARTA